MGRLAAWIWWGFYDYGCLFAKRSTLIGIAYEGKSWTKYQSAFDMPLDAVLSPAGISNLKVVANFDSALWGRIRSATCGHNAVVAVNLNTNR